MEKTGWNWRGIRCRPFDELEKITCESGTEPDLPDLVCVTEYDYRRMTETGVVKTILEECIERFSAETDPADVIAFTTWQLDKLDLDEARYLYEWIYFDLKQVKKDHPYREKWREVGAVILEYMRGLENKRANERKVVYVCPGKGTRIYCLFSNGQWRIWDAAVMLDIPLMQRELSRNPNFFREGLAVINDTLAWDTAGDKDPYMCIDVDPAAIYEQGQPLSMEELVQLAEQTE